MNPDQYRAAIARLGFKSPSLAGVWFGVHPATGRKWALKGPPNAVAKFVCFLLAARHFSPALVDGIGRECIH